MRTRHCILLAVISGTILMQSAHAEPAETRAEFLRTLQPADCKGGAAIPTLKSEYEKHNALLALDELTTYLAVAAASAKHELYRVTGQALHRMDADIQARKAKRWAELNIENRFRLADAALSAGCLDIAGHQYREIIKRYSEPSQQGYRDRASLGLDDVKSKQPSALSSALCRYIGIC